MRRSSLITMSILLAAGILTSACAADLAAQADIPRCGGDGVTAAAANGAVRWEVRPAENHSVVRLAFARPLATTGKERLQLEGRSEESSGQGLVVAQVVLLDAAGAAAATYEPDLRFPPEWNLCTVLLSEFDKPVPAQVSGVEINLWAPNEVGKRMALSLRRCEFWSAADVAAAVRPPARPARAKAQPRALPVPPAERRWSNLGPGGGGWYRTVAFSPHDGTCFVGADVGGIYRSRDGCRTWQIVNTGLPQLYVNGFAFHPTDPRVVFAGCYGGVLKSTDGGDTWQVKRAGFPPLATFGQTSPISAVMVDPRRPNVVYAGVGHERDYGTLDPKTSGGRIYRSEDAGETWQMSELPGGDAARTLSVFCFRTHPKDAETLYATTQSGLFRSTDAGRSWQALGKGMDGYATTFLAIRQDAPETMLLAYHRDGAGRGGVLKSTDAGATWAPSNQGLPELPDCWRLIPHPRDPQTYYAGWHRRSGLFVTRDCGATWQPLNLGGNLRTAWFFEGVNVTGIDVDPCNPDRLVYCNDMDLYQTLDGGRIWDQVCTDQVRPATADSPSVWRGRGCEVLCMNGTQALAVNPADPRILYFGYMDAHAWKSEDGGRTCFRLTNGIHSGYGRMGCVVLDPADPEIVTLSIGANYDRQRVYRSVDGGKQFHLVGYPGTGLPGGAIFSMVVDPSSPLDRRTLYAAVTGYGVYRSDDGGLSWREQSNGLPADSRHALQLVIDPRNSHRLFLASGAHYHAEAKRRVPGYIARTDDGGATWKLVKEKVEPQCVVIDPFDSRKVYVGNRNFSGVDYPNAFYRSEDGGDTWTSLDQTPFLAGPGSRDGDQGARVFLSNVAADPATPGMLYVGCTESSYDVDNGRGVFRSTDWGATWEPFPLTGLSNYRIGTLIVDPVNPSRLYVGTGGNGIFRWGPEAR